MAGGMAISRYTHDAAIAEEIVFAVNQLKLMAEVEVGVIVAVAADLFSVAGRLPFAPLDDQLGIGQIGISAHMVEMQMRVDHVVDSFRVNLTGTQARSQFLAGLIMHLEEFGEFADAVRTDLQFPMQAGVEYYPAFWMLDQEAWDGNFRAPGFVGKDRSEFHLKPS